MSLATTRRISAFPTTLGNLDLVVLLSVILLDLRVFKGSEIASFTIFELFIWGYCLPYVAGRLLLERQALPAHCRAFMEPILVYVTWLLVVSLFWIEYDGATGVLQDAKNIVPVAVLVPFIFCRVRDNRAILLICNLYVVYAVAACLVGFLQHRLGAPYFRDLISGTQYKVDFDGDAITNPVVGFSRHPNEFAVAILPAVVFSALKLMEEIRAGWSVRPTTVLILVVTWSGLVLSQARGVLLFSIAAVAFVTSPLGRTRRFSLKCIWLVLLVAGIMVYGFYKAQTEGVGASDTIEVRYLLWQTAFASLGSSIYHFLFGNGMDYVADWSRLTSGWTFPDAHNAWIDQALFFGVPAVVWYFRIWQRFFAVVERSPSAVPANVSASATNVVLDGLRASVLALMGDYWFEPSAHAVFPLSQLFLLMGLAVRLASLHDSPRL